MSKRGTNTSNLKREFTYRPSRMKRVPPDQRLDVKSGDTELSNIKVTISIRLDADVIEFFKTRASAPGSLPYQTQINSALRSVMDSEGTKSPEYWEHQAQTLESEVAQSRRLLGRDSKQFESVYAHKLGDAQVYRIMAERLRQQA